MTDRHQQKPYPLRMPDELRARLEEAAKAGARSLHAEIVARLGQSFATQLKPDLSPALLATLERLFDEKLGQRAYIDDGKGGHMEDVKIVKKPKD